MPTGVATKIFLIALVVTVSLALIIGLSLHFALPRTIPVERTSHVANCLPESRGGEDGSKSVCEQRG